MIQRVYEGAKGAELLERVIIATDDERIYDAAAKFGAEVRMTSPHHVSGTERAAEVAQEVESRLIINIQGDEPLIEGEMINDLVEALQDERVEMATLMAKNYKIDQINNIHIVKVVADENGNALYFSRSPIPSKADDFFFQHIGIYGYKKDFLVKFADMKPSRLELTEKLEQLRALENGFKVKMVEISQLTLSVDTPEDIIRVEEILTKRG